MTLIEAVKEVLSSAFGKGMMKAVDALGTYDVRRNTYRPIAARNADDLPTPTVQDDIRNMRGDFTRVGGDIREALNKHSALAKQ